MAGLGIGVIGCGASVWMHGPALSHVETVMPAAWFDPAGTSAEQAAEMYGGDVCASLDDLLCHSGVDAVILASPPWLHLEQVQGAVDAGKAILCEKPVARSLAECDAILDAAASVPFLTGFMKRFDPAFVQATEMLRAGELGDLYEIAVDWSWPQYQPVGWRDSLAQAGGGVLMDHGPHTADLACWWAGPVTSVLASVQSRVDLREVEDYAHVVCEHESGVSSIHHHSRLTHRPLREAYRISGSRGTLEIVCEGQWSAAHLQPFRLFLHRDQGAIRSSCVEITPAPLGPPLDCKLAEQFRYSRQLRYFAECVLNKTSFTHGSPACARHSMEIVDAAYCSAATRQTVALPFADTDGTRDQWFEAFRREPRFPHRTD